MSFVLCGPTSVRYGALAVIPTVPFGYWNMKMDCAHPGDLGVARGIRKSIGHSVEIIRMCSTDIEWPDHIGVTVLRRMLVYALHAAMDGILLACKCRKRSTPVPEVRVYYNLCEWWRNSYEEHVNISFILQKIYNVYDELSSSLHVSIWTHVQPYLFFEQTTPRNRTIQDGAGDKCGSLYVYREWETGGQMTEKERNTRKSIELIKVMVCRFYRLCRP